MGAEWRLPELLEQHRIKSIAELMSLLNERGIYLSRMATYRLITQPPIRISLDVLAALCDILTCTPNDLIAIKATNEQKLKRAVGAETTDLPRKISPLKTRIRRPHE